MGENWVEVLPSPKNHTKVEFSDGEEQLLKKYPVDESGYAIAGRFEQVQAWLERVRALPGWANPYDILPGDYIAPKW